MSTFWKSRAIIRYGPVHASAIPVRTEPPPQKVLSFPSLSIRAMPCHHHYNAFSAPLRSVRIHEAARLSPLPRPSPWRVPCHSRRSISTAQTSKPKVIFSGIQPTGVPHLGNYLGALRQWIDLQNAAQKNDQLFFTIVDLHAITSQPDPSLLRRWRKEMLAALLAIGLKQDKCTIFSQSDVSLSVFYFIAMKGL